MTAVLSLSFPPGWIYNTAEDVLLNKGVWNNLLQGYEPRAV